MLLFNLSKAADNTVHVGLGVCLAGAGIATSEYQCLSAGGFPA